MAEPVPNKPAVTTAAPGSSPLSCAARVTQNSGETTAAEPLIAQAAPEPEATIPALIARVLIAGDTHGDMGQVRYLLEVAQREGCTRIVQVGDFGYWPHMTHFDQRVNSAAAAADIEWCWLDGNHENFDRLEREVDMDSPVPQPMGSHLTYLPRGCTWTWSGIRFMALGGAYSIDKHHRREGHSWWPQELLTRQQVERAMDRGPVDVLLTHDAPEGACPIVTGQYKGDEISRGNRKAVTAVMEAVDASILIHGHYHHRYSTDLNGVYVEGLGRDGDGPQSWLILDLAELGQLEADRG